MAFKGILAMSLDVVLEISVDYNLMSLQGYKRQGSRSLPFPAPFPAPSLAPSPAPSRDLCSPATLFTGFFPRLSEASTPLSDRYCRVSIRPR